ncbi:unnamed protein product, partial [Vitis vinifera]
MQIEERMMECGLLQPSHCSCTLCRSLELPYPPLNINTVSNYLSCQAALSALAAHAIEPGEAERQVLGIILGQGQQMTDDDYLQWVVESQRFSLPKEMAEFPSSPIGKIHKGVFSTWMKAVLKH